MNIGLPAWLVKPWAVPAFLAAAGIAVCVVLLLTGAPLPLDLLAIVWPAFSLYVAALALRVALSASVDRRVRRGWIAFSVASLLGIAGDVAWDLLGDGARLPDILYLAEYPAWALGLLLLPVEPARPGERTRIALDLGAVFVASLVAIWDTILRPLAAANAKAPIDLLIAAGMPVGDLLVLAGATALLLRRPDPSTGAAVLMIGAAALLDSVLDLTWAWQTLHDVHAAGGWLDVGWLIERLLLALAALRAIAPPADERSVARTAALLNWSVTVIPLVATGIGFFLILQVVVTDTLDRGAIGTGAGAVVLCALVLVRQTHSAIVNATLNRKLTIETQRSERLLLNILPEPIARRLKKGRPGEPIAETFDDATVLFADIVGFTPLSAKTTPQQLVLLLDEVFSRFDALADRYGLEKIKTIGDAYMAASGVPNRRPDHAEAAAHMALGMRDTLAQLASERGVDLRIRIGLHCGPLVAGVIGKRKFSYDLWGDTVNTASRMESHGLPGAIHLSSSMEEHLRDSFVLEARGTVDVKGKGPMETFLLLAERT